jgi:hypothetical protein
MFLKAWDTTGRQQTSFIRPSSGSCCNVGPHASLLKAGGRGRGENKVMPCLRIQFMADCAYRKSGALAIAEQPSQARNRSFVRTHARAGVTLNILFELV